MYSAPGWPRKMRPSPARSVTCPTSPSSSAVRPRQNRRPARATPKQHRHLRRRGMGQRQASWSAAGERASTPVIVSALARKRLPGSSFERTSKAELRLRAGFVEDAEDVPAGIAERCVDQALALRGRRHDPALLRQLAPGPAGGVRGLRRARRRRLRPGAPLPLRVPRPASVREPRRSSASCPASNAHRHSGRIREVPGRPKALGCRRAD